MSPVPHPRFRPLLAGLPALLVPLAFLACRNMPWPQAAAGLGLPPPPHEVRVERNLNVPMRDGVRLAADLYRPKGLPSAPVIVIRTPYGKRNLLYGYEFTGGLFASQGYAVLIQDVRGKFRSRGDFYPSVHEGPDGEDTIRWAARQPWCSGRIGLFGISYNGMAAWQAAPGCGEELAALVPVFATQRARDVWMSGGAFHHSLLLAWHHENDGRKARPMSILDWYRGIWSLPLAEADDRLGRPNPIYDAWIAHPEPGPFWEAISVDRQVERIRSPALLMAGWFDPFVNAMLEDFNRLRAWGGGAARESRLIVGPWSHATESRFRDLDFGKEAGFLGQTRAVFRWFDRWLKGTGGEADGEGPIRLFVMGANRWRTEREWPLARTRYTELFLHSGGWANSAGGDGTLSADPPGGEVPDVFVYDPADPVPSQRISLTPISYSQPVNQREVEKRQDVLVYTSGPLTEDLEVTGPVRLILYVSSTATDTDFTARLTDVHPDGGSYHLTSGIVRARYRDPAAGPALLEPDRVYRLRLELGATSNVFRRGHRLRLQVSSSDFPRYDRNLNTGEPIGTSARMEKARQTVFHTAGRSSRLILPVIPAEAGAPADEP